MTIAGSDSGGGAGIQADLKTFAALGVHGTSVVTAVTAQNTTGLSDIHRVPVSSVRAQIRALFADFRIAAIKTGMLPSAEVVACVAEELKGAGDRPLVIDPVMLSSSGAELTAAAAIEELVSVLFPMATVVTPNLREASLLAGMEIETDEQMEEAAGRIGKLGPRWVLIKGGHASGPESTDLLADGREVLRFRAERQGAPDRHGTGCVFASAVAARLARGESVPRAVRNAKSFITEAIRHGIDAGRGPGPVDPFYFLPEWRASIDRT